MRLGKCAGAARAVCPVAMHGFAMTLWRFTSSRWEDSTSIEGAMGCSLRILGGVSLRHSTSASSTSTSSHDPSGRRSCTSPYRYTHHRRAHYRPRSYLPAPALWGCPAVTSLSSLRGMWPAGRFPLSLRSEISTRLQSSHREWNS